VDHITTNHPGLNMTDSDKCFMVDIQIQEQEERGMGILPALTDAYRDKHNYLFLRGEDLAVVQREVEEERGHTKKRSRCTVRNSKNKKQRH